MASSRSKAARGAARNHYFARRAQAIDVEDESFCAAARGHEFNLGQLVRNNLQPHQPAATGAPLSSTTTSAPATPARSSMMFLAKAAQARHRVDQADFRERLIDGVFGHPQRVGDGQSAHVCFKEGIQQLRDLARRHSGRR